MKSKQPLKESYEQWFGKLKEDEIATDGYVDVMYNDPAFEDAIKYLQEVWDNWKKGPATDPSHINPARKDLLLFIGKEILK